MKYYRIVTQDYYGERIASYADFINDVEEKVFKEIGDGQIIKNIGVFDNFFLSSYDKEEFWEWNLFDVHKFYGKPGLMTPNLLISKKLKNILEDHNIAEPNHYYKSNLIYKKEKFDYYIFQFTGNKIFKNTLSYIDFNKSVYLDPVTKENIYSESLDDFLLDYKRIYKANGIENKLKNKKLVLKDNLDFFPIGTIMKDNLVSARLKNSIEENDITGFEFSELDYEVIIEKK